MCRGAGRRLVAVAMPMAAIVPLSACGSDQGTPSASSGSSSAPATGNQGEPTLNPETPVQSADPTAAETPELVAKNFAEQAMSDLAILTAPNIEIAMRQASNYLTADLQALLPTLAINAKWGLLPYQQEGQFEGGTPITARATPRTSTVIASNATQADVQVVVDYVWTYDNLGDIRNTRTYTLVMVPGTDPEGRAWQISGFSSEDGVFNN